MVVWNWHEFCLYSTKTSKTTRRLTHNQTQTILPISIHPDEYEWDETAFDAISVI